MAPSEAELVAAKLDSLAADTGEIKAELKALRDDLGTLKLRVAEEYLTKTDYQAAMARFEERNTAEHERIRGVPAWATLAISLLGSLATGLLVYSLYHP